MLLSQGKDRIDRPIACLRSLHPIGSPLDCKVANFLRLHPPTEFIPRFHNDEVVVAALVKSSGCNDAGHSSTQDQDRLVPASRQPLSIWSAFS